MNTRRISTVLSVGALALVTACSSSPRRGEAYGSAPIYSSQPGYNQAPAYPQQQANAYALIMEFLNIRMRKNQGESER